MTADEIRRRITALPFRPFRLHIADGRAIAVHARDFILVSPLGLVVDVFQPNEEHDIIDTALITSISFDPPPPQPVTPNPSDTNA
jgi:hypothetical protein